MTVLCDVQDCFYNLNKAICTRDPCMISRGMCEWVYKKQNGYNINPEY